MDFFSSLHPSSSMTHPTTPVKHTGGNKHALISTMISKMIVTDLLPVRIVEGKGFQELVRLIDPTYNIVTQQQMWETVLPWYVKLVQEKIRPVLKEMDRYILTLDVWNINLIQSYLGLSVSYLSSTWEPKTIVLACSYIVRFEEIPSVIQDLLKAYGIQWDLHYSIIVHKQRDYSPTCGLLGSQDEEENNFTLSLPHTSAFSSLLTASIQEGLAKGITTYKPVLDTVTLLIEEIKKSTSATEAIFGNAFNDTKMEIHWIIHLRLIRCILNHTPNEEAELDILKQRLFPADHEVVLTEIVSILELFEEAVVMMNGDQQLPISVCLPSFVSLSTHLAAKSSGICAHLASSMLSALEKNLFATITRNELYVCAAVLDPRFKLTWCNNQMESENYKRIVIEEAKKITAMTDSPPNNFCSSGPSSISLSNSKLFSFISNSTTSTQPISLTPEKELDTYLKEDCCDDPFGYWKLRSSIYPTLGKLAKQVLCVPAGGTPINSVFNYANKFVETELCSWNPRHLEVMLFLKASMPEVQFPQ